MNSTTPAAPTFEERDQLFRAFARALFERDLDALYATVTPDFVWRYHDGEAVTKRLADRAAVDEHLTQQRALFSEQRFHDVVYHHLPETSFMTFRVSETVRATSERREQSGIEHYLFRDGRIALKDVYRKPTT
jgi:ketosteroid isomerase-like protein